MVFRSHNTKIGKKPNFYFNSGINVLGDKFISEVEALKRISNESIFTKYYHESM